MKVFVFIMSVYTFSQLSTKAKVLRTNNPNYCSIYAYKLPYRGENYKFYGTISYHVLGRAYVNDRVHNSIVESFKISETNCDDVNFRLLKCTKRNFGYLQTSVEQKDGFSAIFMTPLKNKKHSLKLYYRTWLYKFIKNYNSDGISVFNKSKSVDFDNMSQFIVNLDVASRQYNLKIKKIIFDKRFIKKLYKSKNGKELKKRNIYFAKYLSTKVNKKYDDLFYVEFEFIK